MTAVYGALLLVIGFIAGIFFSRATRASSDYRVAVKGTRMMGKARWAHWRTALIMLIVGGLVLWMIMTSNEPSGRS
jgi:ABC-type Fe3+ transport system permease subunit